MTVRVHRGGGGEISVPITALEGFWVRENVWPDRKHSRYELTALMLCTHIPEGEVFGHSCMHGPPPHLIRVIIRPDGMSRHGSRSSGRMLRLRDEISALAHACRAGIVVSEAA